MRNIKACMDMTNRSRYDDHDMLTSTSSITIARRETQFEAFVPSGPDNDRHVIQPTNLRSEHTNAQTLHMFGKVTIETRLASERDPSSFRRTSEILRSG